MESFARLIPEVIKFADGHTEMLSAACCAAWGLTVGEATQKASRAVRLTERTLTVAVRDAHWKRQLEALAPQIIFRLNSFLRQPVVTRIHVIVDKQCVAPPPSPGAAPRPAAPPPAIPLPAEILAGAQAIPDAALREQFIRLATVCLSRNRR